MNAMLENIWLAGLRKVGLQPVKTLAQDEAVCMTHERAAVHAHSIVSTATADGILLHCNELFERALGYTQAELVGREVGEIYASDDVEMFHEIRELLRRGQNWSGEQRLKHKNGKIVWVRATIYPILDAAGAHVKTISIRTDITDSKQSRSERDIYRALHTMQDEIFMVDTEALKYEYMNEAAKKRFGWTDADFIGQTLTSADPNFDSDAFNDAVRPLLDGEECEVRLMETLDGETFESTIQLMQAPDGNARFACIRHNVSERVALERAKDEFTATVSHELRSPLTSIKGGLGLVLSGATGELTDKTRNLVEIAHRNSERLVLIVNDMLDLEKMAAGKMVFEMRDYDARQLFSEALDANDSYLAQYGVTVAKRGFDSAPMIHCDPDRMLQVLNNLLTNAAKFSPRGGEVHAILENTKEGVILSVQDFGAGIPKAAQATIFERFSQAKNSRTEQQGTGLGLSIVKAIVDHHKGSVTLASEEGKGTTIRICLPHLVTTEDTPALRKAS